MTQMKFNGSTIKICSFAKVNLTLDVLSVRPDGFHDIESVIQSIGLHDLILISAGDKPGIHIECSKPGIPTDEKNLAHKAAAFVLKKCNQQPPGLDIRINKRIPVEAGLGGGSSNAAAVIRGLDRLLDLSIGSEEALEIAASIGSDVPFFMVGGTALVAGRGEIIQPQPDIAEWYMVIAKPDFGVSTAWAYKHSDEISGSSAPKTGEKYPFSSRMLKCIKKEEWALLPEFLGNDLEAPTIEQHPEIAQIKEDLLQTGARASLMCGSGSAVYGLYHSLIAASKAAEEMQGRGSDIFVTSTVAHAEVVKEFSKK